MILIFSIILTSLIFLYYYDQRKKNLFPGPTGLPLLGYIPFIRKELSVRKYFLVSAFSRNKKNYFQNQFYELSQKYGAIINLKFGLQNFVVFNDRASIEEALNTKEF